MPTDHSSGAPKDRESLRYKLPSLITLDKIGIMFLISGAAAMVLLIHMPNSTFEHFRFGFFLCFGLLIGCALPVTLLRHRLNQMRPWLATILVILLCLSVVVLIHFSTFDLTPVDLKDSVGLGQRLLVALIVTVSILRYNYVQQSLLRREESELHARIQALQSRIRPHFLFNSMNIIASLIPVDPDTAETVVEDLSELFRASLQEEGSEVSIDDEIELCRRYMRIEYLRLGNRLNIDWRIEKTQGSARIPLLTLQPLLENAVYHGIQPLPEGGTITVALEYAQDSYTITVTNPRLSADLSRPVNSKYAPEEVKGNQLAIRNIRSRLDMLYGKAARLDTHESDQEFVTRITLPKVPVAR